MSHVIMDIHYLLKHFAFSFPHPLFQLLSIADLNNQPDNRLEILLIPYFL